MRKFLFYLEFTFLGTIIWCILYESISIEIVLTGIFVGLLSIVFSNKFLMANQTYTIYYNPIKFIAFIIILLFNIIKSGIIIIPSLITGKINVGIVKIETKVDSGLPTSIIANAITLTPGTVTIDKNKNQLTVLWLNVKSRNKEKAGKYIKGDFEKIFLRGQK